MTGDVSEPLLESGNSSVQALALSADGESLYIAQARRPLLVLSTTTTSLNTTMLQD
jgi:hypothetical protein